MTPEALAAPAVEDPHTALTAVGLLNAYVPIFAVAFLTSLLATPLVRRFAVAQGIVDRPDAVRKLHAFPIAYLGGVSIFAAIVAGVITSYMLAEPLVLRFEPVPIAVLIGVLAIAFTGLADDVWGFDPRLKIAGQLVAAAALAVQDVGVRVAEGILAPLIGAASVVIIDLGDASITNQDVFYWVGTALVAIFVLGGCNAANFLDGLDGLLSGTVAIMAVGFLAISVAMAVAGGAMSGEESLSGARIVLSLALLGAVLGFMPYNFNPAVIFLGDCGSLLLGYLCAVLILMFGDEGNTHLVFAGLIVFSVPIIDTALAILRRRLAGVSMATADTNHIHHQLRRSLGGVKRAVFAIYGITAAFAAIGFTLAWMVLETIVRFRVVYAVAAVLFGFIAAFAFKAARRVQWEAGLATPTIPTATASIPRPVEKTGARPAAPMSKQEPASTP